MKDLGLLSMGIGFALMCAVPVLICLGFFGSPAVTAMIQISLAAYLVGSLLDTAADCRDGRLR